MSYCSTSMGGMSISFGSGQASPGPVAGCGDHREVRLIPTTNTGPRQPVSWGSTRGQPALTAVSQHIPIEQTKRQLTGPAQGIDSHAGGVLRRCQPSRRAPAGHQAGPTRRPAGTAPTLAPHALPCGRMAYGYPGPSTSSALRDCSRQRVAATWTTAAWAGVHAARRRPSTGLQAPQHSADSAGSLRGLFSGMGEKHGPAPPWNETRGCVAGRHAAATNLGFGYGQVHAAVTLGGSPAS
jgi:hypothetical protein